MAISTDSAIEYFGTQDTVTAGGGTAAVVDGAYSAASDIVTWTNDDDAPIGVLIFSGTFSVAPVFMESVNIWAQLKNIDGTSHGNVLEYLGTVGVKNSTSAQYLFTEVKLPNTKAGQEYDFYIENLSGQTISAGWVLKVTPKTIGPHA